MIKSIIFDWGGVLIHNPHPGLITYCARYLGVSKEEFSNVHKKFEDDFQKGTISEDNFWENVCSELKIQKPNISSLWQTAVRNIYSENKEVFYLASSLKTKGYKIGFLSNTEIPAMNFFKKQNYDMFDVTVFSCLEGARKPEKRIYQIALKRLNARPKEAIFIDDKKEYICGAEKIGINSILFKNQNQLKEELTSFSVRLD